MNNDIFSASALARLTRSAIVLLFTTASIEVKSSFLIHHFPHARIIGKGNLLLSAT